MSTRPAEDAAPRPTRREIVLVFAGLMMAMAMAALDQNIVSTALPRIVGELGGLSHLSWVVTVFMLASTATTPLYGKLSDMYGRKPLFMVSISVFLVGSMLCGAAGTMTQLIVFRGIQGVGAGGLMTLSQTTIGDMLEPRERSKYQGLFAGTFAVCSVVGPLVGGVLTTALSWRWVFYVNLPVGLAAIVLIWIGLKRPNRVVRHQIDYLGAILLVAGTSTLLLMLSWGGSLYAWDSHEILALAAATIGMTALLMVQEQRAGEPMLPLGLFRNRIFSTGSVIGALIALGLFGTTVFLPLFFQLVKGKDPATAGLLMAPQIGGMIVASVLGGQLMARTGRYKIFLIFGLLSVMVGFGSLSFIAVADTGLLPIEACLIALGFGMGLAMPTLTVVIQNAVPRGDLGVATSGMSFLRSLGGSVGVALSGGIMTARLHALLPKDLPNIGGGSLLDAGVQQIGTLPEALRGSVLSAYQHAIASTFITGGLVAAIGLLLVFTLPERPIMTRRHGSQPTEMAEA